MRSTHGRCAGNLRGVCYVQYTAALDASIDDFREGIIVLAVLFSLLFVQPLSVFSGELLSFSLWLEPYVSLVCQLLLVSRAY